jgi:hypothetical protein
MGSRKLEALRRRKLNIRLTYLRRNLFSPTFRVREPDIIMKTHLRLKIPTWNDVMKKICEIGGN